MTENDSSREEGVRLTDGQSEVEEQGLPPPPDGGYGWVIVFASFMCNLVVDGIGYSFGIFLPELVKFFGLGKGTVAWVGSLLAGMLLVAGPIVSALCNKFGCRAVCIAGAVFAAAAFALSSFSQSVTVMMLTYGLLGGFGFGMIYLPSIVAVGYYFDTRRSLATGIAVCGSGVGTFSFAPLAAFLLSTFGTWQRANLVLAGIILCCSIWGALMKPLTFPDSKDKPLLQRMAEEKKLQMALGSVDGTLDKKSQGENGSAPAPHLSRNVSSPVFNSTSPGLPQRGSVPSFQYHRKQSFGDSAVYNSKLSVAKEPPRMVRPLSRKDIFYSGSVLNLPQFQSQKSLAAFRQSMASLPQSRVGDVETQDQGKCCGCLPNSFRTALSSMMDMSLLRDPAFMLIAVSNFFGMAGLYVPFVYIVDAARLNGVDGSQASFLLSIIGITNTIGRIVCGYVADFPWMDSLMLNNVCLVIATISVGLTPFCASYATYVAVAIAFGIAIAGYISLTSIILVDLLGLDKLTNAFGLLILFRGVAAIIGSPLAGAVYDATKTYDASFYIGAVFFLLASVLSFAAKFFRKQPEAVPQPLDALAPINEDLEESNEEEDEAPNQINNGPSGYSEVSQKESVM
ncbi:monocarboxylate transporter 4-like isoform X2 [Pectinophora gossypiella]|uniref:monocarboxylate transporter 4-like isoform X2 n=1 Tax=Pectinophora gossypiella TaxID=13191 RepID=UPI00214E4BA6|nr:monocarboxylate transporter 4-like isoform X2 [Pectinophora gossypiella]